jgi:hypothetical protein
MTKYVNRVVHATWKGVIRAYKIIAKVCEGRRQERRLRHKWEDDIKTDLKE